MSDLTKAQSYAKGLLIEEFGEAIQMVGKADRFGIDTPGSAEPPYHGMTARQLLTIELGDALAAIEYSCLAGLIDREDMDTRAQIKLARLLDPNSCDNLGRRLAPNPLGD